MIIERKDKQVDFLIIVPPARNKNTMWPPYGALYVASFLKQSGRLVEILNVDETRIPNNEVIKQIREISPRYLGFTGMVATSYKYIKDLSMQLKKSFPAKIQILGGGLSTAAETILENTGIDIVVLREGEITIRELLDALDNSDDLNRVLGIYFKNNNNIVFTGKRQLIMNLDVLPYPAFDLVNMDYYLSDGRELVSIFGKEITDRRIFDKKRNRKLINILTNRGCIGTCSFCARPDPGLRTHSIKYVFDFIEYCKNKFDFGFLSFGDECFAANKSRHWQFIEEYKKRNLDLIFRLSGVRVDTVDKDILKAYKEIGCWMISFGFESGSQKMLNIIDKRVTVEQNIDAAIWAKEVGIYTPPQLIIGMPGETKETIQETINFLKSINYLSKHCKATFALPVPGTPLYEYARLTGAIDNEDKYLCSLKDIEGTQVLHVNVTESDDEEVAGWRNKINQALFDFYYFKKYKIKNNILKKVIHFFEAIMLHMKSRDLLSILDKRFKRLFYSLFNMKRQKNIVQQKYCQFRKKKNLNIEDFLQLRHTLTIDRDISLRKVNQRLQASIHN